MHSFDNLAGPLFESLEGSDIIISQIKRDIQTVVV